MVTCTYAIHLTIQIKQYSHGLESFRGAGVGPPFVRTLALYVNNSLVNLETLTAHAQLQANLE